MNEPTFTVQVPASTSNVGSGFDTVSAALSLYLEVKVDVTGTGGIEWARGWELSPQDNAVELALRRALDHLGIHNPGLRLEMDNPIPLKRGLGSSGAAIVAGIRIAERLGAASLSPEDIFEMAYPLEGHPDNLSASLLGGWVLSWVSGGRMQAVRLDDRLNCRFVVAVPEIAVSTREARAILPQQYPRADAVFNLQRCGLLVYSILAGQPQWLREATRDRLHQPYRARLVPGMLEALELEGLPSDLSPNLLSLSISGSGSTLIATAGGRYEEIGNWITETLARYGTRAHSLVLDLDRQGGRVLPG